MTANRYTRVTAMFFLATLAGPACSGPASSPGKPCTVTANDNGTATVLCPDGSKTILTNGANGTNGTIGVNGTNGTSCSLFVSDAGGKTITCTDGTSVTVTDGQNGVDGNAMIDFSTLTPVEQNGLDLSVTVSSITNDARPVATFAVRNSKGQPVKNIPPADFSGLALLQLVPGDLGPTGNGVADDTWVSHITNCATCVTSTETANAAQLIDAANGTYRYTFAKDIKNPTPYDGGQAIAGVAFDANAVHRFGMRIATSSNSFRPVDVVYDYVPATGAVVTGENDKVATATCLGCHQQWRANPLNAGGVTPFHNGQRYEVQYCVVCHNEQRKYSGTLISGNSVIAEPTIDGEGMMTPPSGQTSVRVLKGQAVLHLPVFIHKIHMGDRLTLKGPYAGLGTELNEIAFPQSPANCKTCHINAALADHWQGQPSRRACGSCHDAVDFVTGANHTGGPQADDKVCAVCHSQAGIAAAHVPLEPPDPANIYSTPVGGNNYTNASWLGNPLTPPPGAKVVSYSMPKSAVSTVDAGAGNVFARVKFVFLINDAGVVFNASNGTNELIDGFTGSPSVTCAFAMPQDGLAAPGDFNVQINGYLKTLWRGTATGAGAGNLTGPDTSGYYTATLTGVAIPPAATMLTCGVGYSYALAATQPLTQIDLPGELAYDAGTRVGGLSVPAANIWQVAAGYTGRRGSTNSAVAAGQIVSTAKCNNCHNRLGVAPTFHVGQRNDAPTCSFCHTPNKTSSGWSAGSESFVHAIHGAGVRRVPFNWHAISEDEGFYKIAFPGRPQLCEGCHNAGYFDFSAAWYTDERVASRLMQTVATGTFNSSPTLADGGVNSASWAVSPYVNGDGGVNYGAAYAYNTTSMVVTEASPNTLANSPISNACFGCHDAPTAIAHMRTNGGLIYAPRPAVAASTEQCLICHGPGRMAAIRDVHAR